MAEETDFVDLSLGNNMPRKKKDKAGVKDQTTDQSQTVEDVLTLTIKVDKLQLLENKMAKIARTFGVHLEKEQRPMASDAGKVPDVQWIRIRGGKRDCRDASMYVSNLCNPVSWHMMEYPPEISQLFDDDSCLRIEQQSGAVLLNDQPGILVLHGRDELPVLMAVSIIEDIILKNVDSNASASFAASSTDTFTSSTSLMDDMLQKVWADADGKPESSELSLIPDEVKRAMLISMCDDDDVEMDDSDSGCGSCVQTSDADRALDHAVVDPDVTVHVDPASQLVDPPDDTVDAASDSRRTDLLQDVTLTGASSFVTVDQCSTDTFSPLVASVSKFATALQQNEALSAAAPFRLCDQYKSNTVSDKSSPLALAISAVATASPAGFGVQGQNASLSTTPLFRHADQSQCVPFTTSSPVASASQSRPGSVSAVPFPSKFGFQGGSNTTPFKLFDQSGNVTSSPLAPLASSTFVRGNHDMLKKLARQKNYSESEIEQVLSRDYDWKESEFLRALHTNRRRLRMSGLGQSTQHLVSAPDKTSLTVVDMELQTFNSTITDLQQANSRQDIPVCASPSVIVCDPGQVSSSRNDKTPLTVPDMQLQTPNATAADLRQADSRQHSSCASPSVVACNLDQVRSTIKGNGKRNSDEFENDEFSLYCVVDDADEVDDVDDDNLIDLRDDDDQDNDIKQELDKEYVDRTREVVLLQEDHNQVYHISSDSSDEIEEIYPNPNRNGASSSTGPKTGTSVVQKDSAGGAVEKKGSRGKVPRQQAKGESFLHSANTSRMNEMDFISLIPSSSTPTRIPANSMPAGAGHDSWSTNLPSMKPVIGKKKRRKLAAQQALDRSRSPHRVDMARDPANKVADAVPVPGTSRQQAAPVSLLQMVTVPPTSMQQQTVNNTVDDLAALVSQPPPVNAPGDLRYIVVDGSNVAMSHGNSKFFSCKGIEIVINHFLERGHTKITALVPQWRRQRPPPDYPLADQHILEKLKNEGRVVFTPARRLGNRNINCYDDRFMVELAIQTNGIVVTNDNYRDLYLEKSTYRPVIETRLLPYSFVGDIFMVPEDPLGRNGPRLDDFLRMPGRPAMLPPIYRPAPNQPLSVGNRLSFQQQPQQQYWQQMYPRQQQPQQQQYPQQQQHPQSLWPPPAQNAAGYQQRSNFRPHYRPPQSNMHSNRWSNTPQNAGGAIRSASVPSLPMPAAKSQPIRSQHQTQELRKQLLEVFPANQKEIDRVLMKHSTCNVEHLCCILSDELS